MFKKPLLASIILVLALPICTFAVSDEEATENALKDTQEHLKDSSKRKELLKTDNAKKANESAQGIVGAENMDEMYGIVAEIMPYITKESNGDPQKMSQMMAEFQKNPEAFYKKLPAETQRKIKALSEKVEKKSPATAGKNH